VKLSNSERILAVALVAYIVFDILLTPPAHLETRDPALVTGLGIGTLVLLFIGLALSVVALVLLFRRSRRTSMVAIVGALLYFPAPLIELTGHFSSLRPPAAIAWIELIQAVVAVIVIGAGFWVLRLGEP
jgi:LPXTG-motif cell wall-anchored protein